MEAHLKPAKLDTDPSSPVAAQEYSHWKVTMENFLSTLKVENDADKYKLLINFLSSSVFTYVSDVKSYTLAMEALESIYNKPKNIWFSRHILLHTKQQPNQSLDDFVCVLKNLSKDCAYSKPVTAEEHKNQSILSAFIGGISSSFIQQRLLECDNEKLTLAQAITQARTLESSLRNTEGFKNNSYPHSQACSVTDLQPPGVNNPQQVNALKSGGYGWKKKKCWFCGGPVHPRSKCPARDDTCTSCGKLGHWAKCCNSKSENSAALFIPSQPIAQMPRLTALTHDYSKTVLIEVNVDGLSAVALVDSGARGANFMDKKFRHRSSFMTY